MAGISHGSKWAAIKPMLECPRDKDADYENDTWCNRDLIPIPPDRRTYGPWSYIGYWTVAGSCIAAWSLGSTLLSLGLSPQQAIGAVIIGGILTGLLAVVCGWVGEKHYIGYTVSSRSAWGMWGAYFPVLMRILLGCVWFGIQAFWGGQATRVSLSALSPSFAYMPSHLDPNPDLKINDLIGLIVWMLLFIPWFFIKPERLQVPFCICFFLFFSSCIGLLAWSVSQVKGAGKMFHEPSSTSSPAWAFMFSINSILGAWGGGTLGQSDWTRYASKRCAPTFSQLVASPATITVTSIVGIIVTSAAHDILQAPLQWNPILLLAEIQDHYESRPAVRAAVFLASLGMIGSQLSISMVLNAMSSGMDLAGLWPRYINIRRGACIMAILGIASQPWLLLGDSGRKFLTVMSGLGIFSAPATGVMLADYHAVRRRRLNVKDLYVGNSTSIYWFDHGFNWRAFVAFFVGTVPLLPGLAGSVEGNESANLSGWIRLYNLSFPAGLSISFAVHWLLHVVVPLPVMEQDSLANSISDMAIVNVTREDRVGERTTCG